MNVQQSDLTDPALVAEVDLARAAAQEEAGDERVGDYVEHHVEDEAAVTHHFEADKASYQGWRWAVTITSAGPAFDVTVSEVVLLPGPTALVAPEWIPWQDRVQAGDLGVGDLLPPLPDDPRLVPAYAESDDPAVEEVATDIGLGRVRVMSRPARLDAADRWQQSEFGPQSDMARSAPAHCGTCGFYLPLAGSLRASFGTCGNEMAPADGHVVHTEYGCGAHSEAEVEQVSPVLVADLIYDDALLDVEPLEVVDSVPEPAAETKAAESAVVDAPEAEAIEPGTPAEPSAPLTEPTAAEPTPASESVVTADAPAADPTPVTESTVAADEATPAAEPTAVAVEPTPADEPTVAAAEPTYATESTPATEPTVVADAAPAAEPTAVADTAPAVEPTAAAEPTVVPDAAPAADATAVAEPTVVADAAPADESTAVADEAPAAEPTVVADAAPAVEAEPTAPAVESEPSTPAAEQDTTPEVEADAASAPEPTSESNGPATTPDVAATPDIAVDAPAAETETTAAVEAPATTEPSGPSTVSTKEPANPTAAAVEAVAAVEGPADTSPTAPASAEAPAGIEPVVTAETSDESTRRE